MPRLTLFIQYRPMMFDQDYAHFKMEYHGRSDMGLVVDVKERLPVEDGTVHRGVLAYEVIKGLEPVIPRALSPSTTFVVFAHNLNHDMHHKRDYHEALEVFADLGFQPEGVDVIECVMSPTADSCGVRKVPFSRYFSDVAH